MNKLIITKINDGYVEPVIQPEDYIFGVNSPVPDVILEPTGQWIDVLPEDETQQKTFDTYNCTGFSSLSQIEIMWKKLYNI